MPLPSASEDRPAANGTEGRAARTIADLDRLLAQHSNEPFFSPVRSESREFSAAAGDGAAPDAKPGDLGPELFHKSLRTRPEFKPITVVSSSEIQAAREFERARLKDVVDKVRKMVDAARASEVISIRIKAPSNEKGVARQTISVVQVVASVCLQDVLRMHAYDIELECPDIFGFLQVDPYATIMKNQGAVDNTFTDAPVDGVCLDAERSLRGEQWLDLETKVGDHAKLVGSGELWLAIRYWKVPANALLRSPALLGRFVEEVDRRIKQDRWFIPDQYLIQLAGLRIRIKTADGEDSKRGKRAYNGEANDADSVRTDELRTDSFAEVKEHIPAHVTAGTDLSYWCLKLSESLERVRCFSKNEAMQHFIALARNTPLFGCTLFPARRENGECLCIGVHDMGLLLLRDGNEDETSPNILIRLHAQSAVHRSGSYQSSPRPERLTRRSRSEPLNDTLDQGLVNRIFARSVTFYEFSQMLSWRITSTGARFKFFGATEGGHMNHVLANFTMNPQHAAELYHLLNTYVRLSPHSEPSKPSPIANTLDNKAMFDADESLLRRRRYMSEEMPAGSTGGEWVAVYHRMRKVSSVPAFLPFLRSIHQALESNKCIDELNLSTYSPLEGAKQSSVLLDDRSEVCTDEQLSLVAESLRVVRMSQRTSARRDVIFNRPKILGGIIDAAVLTRICVSNQPVGTDLRALITLIQCAPDLRALEMANIKLPIKDHPSLLRLATVIPHLEMLDISRNGIGDRQFAEFIKALDESCPIAILRASGNKISDKAARALGQFLRDGARIGRRARVLDLSANKLTDTSLVRLLGEYRAETTEPVQSSVPVKSGTGNQPAKRKKARMSLTLRSFAKVGSISGVSNLLKEVGEMEADDGPLINIKLLDISGNAGITSKGAATLAEYVKRAHALRSLNMESTSIGMAGCALILAALRESRTTAASTVDLGISRLSAGPKKPWDEYVKNLADASRLAGFALVDTDITAKCLCSLLQAVAAENMFKGLTKLDLARTGVSFWENSSNDSANTVLTPASGINSVLKSSTLEWLSLAHTDIFRQDSKRYASEFANALRSNTSLLFLDLTNSGLDYHVCNALGSACLSMQQSLRTLVMDDNHSIGARGVESLVDGATTSPSLSALSLAGCRIGISAITPIKGLLCAISHHIRQVDLRRNDDYFAKSIAQALKLTPTVVELLS